MNLSVLIILKLSVYTPYVSVYTPLIFYGLRIPRNQIRGLKHRWTGRAFLEWWGSPFHGMVGNKYSRRNFHSTGKLEPVLLLVHTAYHQFVGIPNLSKMFDRIERIHNPINRFFTSLWKWRSWGTWYSFQQSPPDTTKLHIDFCELGRDVQAALYSRTMWNMTQNALFPTHDSYQWGGSLQWLCTFFKSNWVFSSTTSSVQL